MGSAPVAALGWVVCAWCARAPPGLGRREHGPGAGGPRQGVHRAEKHDEALGGTHGVRGAADAGESEATVAERGDRRSARALAHDRGAERAFDADAVGEGKQAHGLHRQVSVVGAALGCEGGVGGGGRAREALLRWWQRGREGPCGSWSDSRYLVDIELAIQFRLRVPSLEPWRCSGP